MAGRAELLTRKNFLRLSAILCAAAATGGLYKTATFLTSSSKKEIVNQSIIVDFDPSYPGNDQLIREILGDRYISKLDLTQKYAIQKIVNPQELPARAMTEHPNAVILYGLYEEYQTHLQQINQAREQILTRIGYSDRPERIPLQTLVDFHFDHDRNGKYHRLSLNVEPQPVIKALSRYPQSTAVNFSFQFGTSIAEIIFDTSQPEFRVTDAYLPLDAPRNLSKLVSVARACPDKFFVAAAGNHSDDLRLAKQQLTSFNQWPPNLITVAEWAEPFGPVNRVYGADIYVPNQKLGLPPGSSFSVPAVHALSTVLMERGIDSNSVSPCLFDYCKPFSYQAVGNRGQLVYERALVLDLDGVQI